MLGYAIETRSARRKLSPATLALIVAGHALLILAVLNSRMEVPARTSDRPIVLDPIELPKDPPPIPPEPRQSEAPRPREVAIDQVPPLVPIPDFRPSDDYTPLPVPIPDIGVPRPGPDLPKPLARVGPKPATPDHSLRPPYPDAKRRLEEEAVLRLRLSIDERGRVRAVDPVGAADPSFLASARNHLIRHWRYTPASEGGRPVASSITITLRFEIDET